MAWESQGEQTCRQHCGEQGGCTRRTRVAEVQSQGQCFVRQAVLDASWVGAGAEPRGPQVGLVLNWAGYLMRRAENGALVQKGSAGRARSWWVRSCKAHRGRQHPAGSARLSVPLGCPPQGTHGAAHACWGVSGSCSSSGCISRNPTCVHLESSLTPKGSQKADGCSTGSTQRPCKESPGGATSARHGAHGQAAGSNACV